MNANTTTPTAKKRQSNLLSFFNKTPTASHSSEKKQSPTRPTEPKPKLIEKVDSKQSLSKVEAPRKETATALPSAEVKSRTDAASEDVEVEHLDEAKTSKRKLTETRKDASASGASKRRRAVLDSDSSSEADDDAQSADSDYNEAPQSSGDEDESTESIETIKAKVASKLAKKTSQALATSTPKPSQTTKRVKPTATPSTPAISDVSKSFLGSFRADESFGGASITSSDHINGVNIGQAAPGDGGRESRFKHLDFDFLKPELIRDSEKRRPTDEHYNKRTLYVPDDFFRKQTPGHRQWWRMKAGMFDTILLFKVGKFYELYHMDAVVAVNELNLAYMKGDYAHCGFPEIAYQRFADQLVARGHKVARIEQTETPTQLEERLKSKYSKNYEKVVRREVCRVTSMGTRTFDPVINPNNATQSDRGTFEDAHTSARCLLAVREKVDELEQSTYGVCFIDTSVGHFMLCQFRDDEHRSHLRTLLSHAPPAEVLHARGGLSTATEHVFRACLSAAVHREALHPKFEFWSAKQTLQELAGTEYLADRKTWPETLLHMLDDSDCTGQTASAQYELAVSALGAVLWYLREALIDVDMVTLRQFHEYQPTMMSSAGGVQPNNMILDNVTLRNLCVVPSANVGMRSVAANATDGSLLRTLDYCYTAFGKRQLRQWVCAPLFKIDQIVRRQRAVQTLAALDKPAINKIAEFMKQLPDLERLLQRLHSLGLKYRAHEHPDGRAVMFDLERYNKRKIVDLLNALESFKNVVKLMSFVNETLRAEMLARLPQT